jgi:hypothetical protein
MVTQADNLNAYKAIDTISEVRPLTDLSHSVLDALTKVVNQRDGVVGLHEPEFAGNEWKYVKECIDTGWVSSAGRYVDEFEHRLAETSLARRLLGVICDMLPGRQRGDRGCDHQWPFCRVSNSSISVPHRESNVSKKITEKLKSAKLRTQKEFFDVAHNF